MASFGQVALGIASIIYGAHHLRNGVRQLNGQPRSLGRVSPVSAQTPFHDSGRVMTPQGAMRVRSFRIRNLDDRIRHLRDRVDEGKRHPEVIAFARQAVSQRCGNDWCIREKDNVAEAKAIFDAVRRRVRYTSDIHGVDTYQAPHQTLRLRAGDCIPGGTLLLKANGSFAAIEDIRVGDTIFNGSGWTKVTKWWDKGVHDTRALKLNNGANLVCTDEHRLFVVPRSARNKAGSFADAREVSAGDIRLGDDLLQPRELAFADAQTLSRDEAFLLGVYVAEGSVRRRRIDGSLATVSIAGVADDEDGRGKGFREIVVALAARLDLHITEQDRELYLSDSNGLLERLLGRCGQGAVNKRLPHVSWDIDTARTILLGLSADGGMATNDTNFVFSTTSPELALQYRILQRIQGHSTSIKRVDEHGGFGAHPVYRVTVRMDNARRPWAKVKGIFDAGPQHVYDIETDSSRFYLVESDVVVHNCDDYSTLLCSALLSVGIPCRFKVIRTKGGNDWNHIYSQAGFPRANPQRWVSMDGSVPVPFGWEAPSSMVAASRVFPVR